MLEGKELRAVTRWALAIHATPAEFDQICEMLDRMPDEDTPLDRALAQSKVPKAWSGDFTSDLEVCLGVVGLAPEAEFVRRLLERNRSGNSLAMLRLLYTIGTRNAQPG